MSKRNDIFDDVWDFNNRNDSNKSDNINNLVMSNDIGKNDNDWDSIINIYEDRSSKTSQVEKQLDDMIDKLKESNKSRSNISFPMINTLPKNPSADTDAAVWNRIKVIPFNPVSDKNTNQQNNQSKQNQSKQNQSKQNKVKNKKKAQQKNDNDSNDSNDYYDEYDEYYDYEKKYKDDD
jgi:hypothetical protein